MLRSPCRSANWKQFLQTLRRHCCGSNPGHGDLGAVTLADGELIFTRQGSPLSNDNSPVVSCNVTLRGANLVRSAEQNYHD